ncbi:unnamed protein product, partial [Mesorhabditis spiculigera]
MRPLTYLLLLIMAIAAVDALLKISRCHGDHPCPEGYICEDNHCVKENRCKTKSDCPAHYSCHIGKCTETRLLGCGEGCGDGRFCCSFTGIPENGFCAKIGEVLC